MRTFAALSLVVSFAAACEGDVKFVEADGGGGEPPGTPRGHDSAPESSSGEAPGSPFERDEACAPPSVEATKGDSVFWNGWTHEGEQYTCNKCPAGRLAWEGRWRAVHFQTEDPETPLDGGAYMDTMDFSGNLWTWRVRDDNDPAFEVATVEAWFFCSSKPEISSEKTVFVITAADPEGAVGYSTGDVYTADLLLQGGDQMAFLYDQGFLVKCDGPCDAVYCRVGAEVETISGAIVPCDDPWP